MRVDCLSRSPAPREFSRIADRQALPAFPAAGGQDLAAFSRTHAVAEPVFIDLFRLEGWNVRFMLPSFCHLNCN